MGADMLPMWWHRRVALHSHCMVRWIQFMIPLIARSGVQSSTHTQTMLKIANDTRTWEEKHINWGHAYHFTPITHAIIWIIIEFKIHCSYYITSNGCCLSWFCVLTNFGVCSAHTCAPTKRSRRKQMEVCIHFVTIDNEPRQIAARLHRVHSVCIRAVKFFALRQYPPTRHHMKQSALHWLSLSIIEQFEHPIDCCAYARVCEENGTEQGRTRESSHNQFKWWKTALVECVEYVLCTSNG